MALYLNTNIAALYAQQNLSNSQTTLAGAIQQLSSGLRINSAKDDAAGFAIVTRMGSQVAGMNQAIRNANDGISLAQTAGGSMQSITQDLQTMRDLAVQASNATYSSTDRASMQAEVSQLQAEINRVAQSTQFNGVNLLDGSFTAMSFQVGPNNSASNSIQISSIANMQTSQMGSAGTSYGATVTSNGLSTGITAGQLTLNGIQVGASSAGLAPGQSAASASSIAAAINTVTAQSGVTATAAATTETGVAPTGTAGVASGKILVNGVALGAVAAGGTVAGEGANVAAAINAVSSQTGVTASANATTGVVTLTAADGRDISVSAAAGYTTLLADTGLNPTNASTVSSSAAVTAATSQSSVVNGVTITAAAVTGGTAAQQAAAFVTAFNNAAATNTALTGITASSDSSGNITLTSSGLGMTFGAQANTNLPATGTYSAIHGTVTLTSSSSTGIVIGGGNALAGAGFATGTTTATTISSVNSVSNVDISTQQGAQNAISVIDGALNTVLQAQGAMGAYQNRFTAVVSNLQTTVLNLSSAQAQIQDTNYATETTALTQAQILQQAGTAMLAQANALPNSVLTLLK